MRLFHQVDGSLLLFLTVSQDAALVSNLGGLGVVNPEFPKPDCQNTRGAHGHFACPYAQEGSGAPKSDQEQSKRGPRGLQTAARALQEATRRPQDEARRTKISSARPKMRPGCPRPPSRTSREIQNRLEN